jgi:hypothetical protein
MSEITDWAMNHQAALDGISMALDQKFAVLQSRIGVLTPADKIALESVDTASKALVDKIAAINTTITPPPDR